MNNALPEIVIELPPETEGSKVVAPGGGQASSPDAPVSSLRGAETALKHIVSYGAVKGLADRLVNYEISTITLRTGAREYEQKASFWYQQAGRALNAGVAVGVGLLTGNLPLALIGIAASAGSIALGYAMNANTIRIKETREDISIGYELIRAGVINRRGNGGE